jgi:hypothetical protein
MAGPKKTREKREKREIARNVEGKRDPDFPNRVGFIYKYATLYLAVR